MKSNCYTAIGVEFDHHHVWLRESQVWNYSISWGYYFVQIVNLRSADVVVRAIAVLGTELRTYWVREWVKGDLNYLGALYYLWGVNQWLCDEGAELAWIDSLNRECNFFSIINHILQSYQFGFYLKIIDPIWYSSTERSWSKQTFNWLKLQVEAANNRLSWCVSWK
jgi:hypothetical protein